MFVSSQTECRLRAESVEESRDPPCPRVASETLDKGGHADPRNAKSDKPQKLTTYDWIGENTPQNHPKHGQSWYPPREQSVPRLGSSVTPPSKTLIQATIKIPQHPLPWHSLLKAPDWRAHFDTRKIQKPLKEKRKELFGHEVHRFGSFYSSAY